MSKRLTTNSELIKYLFTLRGKNAKIKKLILTLSDEEVKAIGEIAGNLLYGAIPLTELYKKSLKPYKSALLVISNPKTSSRKRRDIFATKPNLVSKVLEAAKSFLKSVI